MHTLTIVELRFTLSITGVDILNLNEMSRYCFTQFMGVTDEGVADEY
jgi:hypothetical protein